MPSLFDSLQVGDLLLPNRIVMAPLTRTRAGEGRVPNALNAEYYAQRASAGLIISEATSVDPMGVGYPGTPGIWTDEQVEGWKRVTRAVHERGGRIMLQLWHVGRISHPFSLQGRLPVAPSAIAPRGHLSLLRPQREFVTPRALAANEIPGIVDAFRKGAKNAQTAGFDGVELHGANGYLLDQFLQDSTNIRTDDYGGCIENRARLLLEVTDAAIAVWGPGRVGMHLSPRCDAHTMGDSNPHATFGYVAEQLGRRQIAFLFTRESPGDNRLSPELKNRFGGVLIANEGFKLASARQALDAGEADAVAFGKLFISNPDLPYKFQNNLPMNNYQTKTFYSFGDPDPRVGYTDYPGVAAETLTAFFANGEPLRTGSVVYQDQAISAEALHLESQRVARAFADLGVVRGDRVAIWLPNTVAWLTCFFACARLGAIAVSINTRFRSAELEDIIGRSGAKILVYWPGYRHIDFTEIIAGLSSEAVSHLETIIAYDESPHEPGLDTLHGKPVLAYRALLQKEPYTQEHASAADGCIIFPTSGTTRSPKFVLHSHASIRGHATDIARSFEMRAEGACSLLVPPMCGVFGFCMAISTLAAGRPLVITPSFDAGQAASLIHKYSVTHMAVVGAVVAQLLAMSTDMRPFPSLRAVIGVRAGQAAAAEKRGLRLVGTYGSSELQAMLSVQPFDAPAEQRELGGGRLLGQGACVRARDEASGEILPPNVRGELEFRLPSQMLGYYGNPEATAKALTPDGFYRSGDLGYTVSEREFVFLARIGDALRLSGFLVNPVEVESLMADHPAIMAAQVVGVDLNGRTVPVAFVTLSPNAQFDEQAILAHCRNYMAHYKVPKRIFKLEAFPVTQGANGDKVQKTRLRDMALVLMASTQ